MPGMYLSPFPNTDRCPFGTAGGHDCAAHCLDFLREMIRRETSGALAAIIVEPIQGTAGNVIPPAGFLRGLKEVAREFDALLISDEMICGFGRTGRMFGCEHDEVVPDVMTVGKGMAGGFPVSGVIASAEVAASKPFGNPSGSSSSYGGNPLAAAAADATLSIIMKHRLADNARRVGAVLLERLQKMPARLPWVGNVRGRGLMLGVDLVEDRASAKPLPAALCREIFFEALGRGLLTMAYNPGLRIYPPLIVSEAEALRGADILESSIDAVHRRHRA